MATFKTPQWFEATRVLRNNGLDVSKLSTRDVSKEELAEAFGPKSNKNRSRYDYRLTSKAARGVEELYCRVTSKSKITNNELTLQFARGLLLEGKGVEVNWAAFAAHLHSHREKVCSVKAENTDRKQREQGSAGVVLHPPKAYDIRSSVVAKSCSYAPIPGLKSLPIKGHSEVRMGRGKMTFAKALMVSKEQLCASLREKVEVLKLEGEKKK